MNRQKQFTEAMVEVYRNAKQECGYNATRFLQMVSNMGGLETARSLLRASGQSQGLQKLFECNRLDLTVEAVIAEGDWSDLFQPHEIEIARQRLIEMGYTPKEKAAKGDA